MMQNDPIRIFIGSSPSEWLPAKVLEYSIRSRTSYQIESVRLCESNITIPSPLHKKNKPKTPFSFQRFLIPGLCNYKGKAIYLDADMLVFSDIHQLWMHDFSDAEILSVKSSHKELKPQFSVMLMNTNLLKWNIDEIIAGLDSGKYNYDQLMYQFVVAKYQRTIDASWNSLEHYDEHTKLLHFTDMNKQPWVNLENPYRNIWVDELANAITSNFIAFNDLTDQIRSGNIRPSLAIEIDQRLNKKPPISDIQLHTADKTFIPPFFSLKPSLFHRLLNRCASLI